jgi:hypothetical protein
MSATAANQDILTGIETLFPPSQATRRRYKNVTLPVNGFTLRIQSLTEREKSNYEASVWKPGKTGQEMDPAKIKTSGLRLAILCVVDSAGNRLLNDTHLVKMQDWDALDTEHLHKECNRHVGIGTTAVEDLEKN